MEKDKIREAFESYQYVMGKFHEDHIFTVQDVVYCMNIAMQSAQEEIQELKLRVENAENQPMASKVVATLSEEIKRLKCCGNCKHPKGHSSVPCRTCERWRGKGTKDNWETKE